MKKIAGILLLSLLFLLSACGGTESETESPQSAEEAETEIVEAEQMESSSRAEDPSLARLREQTKTTGNLMAVAFLGTLSEGGQEAYDELVAPLLESSPFLADLDWEKAAIASGMEVYCVVGRDPDCRITVTEWSIDENGEGKAGEKLYDSDNGEPVLLMGNVSDIMPNLMVTVTTTDGEELTYAPCISLKDGMLDRGGTEGVYDFTVYFDLPPEGIPDYAGDWAAFDVSDHDGREYNCCLTFAPDGSVDYFYYDEPDVIPERFTGTAVNNEDEGTVSLDLTLTGGRYMEEGAPEYSSWGTYRVEMPDGDTLILTLLDGDRLPYGLDIESVRYGRTVG